jgi:hypothetical protein
MTRNTITVPIRRVGERSVAITMRTPGNDEAFSNARTKLEPSRLFRGATMWPSRSAFLPEFELRGLRQGIH